MITSNVIAATALLFSLATQRRENRRDRERRTDKRKQQASRVLASTSTTPSEVDDTYVRLGWVIINHSSQPIYDVTASSPEIGGTAAWDEIAPGAIVRHQLVHARVVEHRNIPSPTVEFLDSAGRRWNRLSTGMLQQANPGSGTRPATWGPVEEPLADLNHPDWVRNEIAADVAFGRMRGRDLRLRSRRTSLIWPALAVLLLALATVVLILIGPR